MNQPTTRRFHLPGLALAVGVGTALTASNGPAVGIAIGVALAVVFGLLGRRTGCGE